MTRVAVLGAKGRMGQEVVKAVEACEDMEIVAVLDTGDVMDVLLDSTPDVVVDFTTPESVLEHVLWCIENGVAAVVGTTGWTPERLDMVRGWCDEKEGARVLVAPNFSVMAVLLLKFAETAARFAESVEIVELHHPDKKDAPSGTARHTAELIMGARDAAGLPPAGPDATDPDSSFHGARGALVHGIPVHSVRLRGLVAHEEVLFGSEGETLTLRHDSFDRASFMPGVLLAVRQVPLLSGLVVGLESLLDL